MERIFAIGDIHGCFDKLEKLMGILPLKHENDRLVFIGDYIDRGPRSRDVVDFVIDIRKRYEKITCLLGNHESMLLQYLDRPGSETRSLYFLNGGDATAASYGYCEPPEEDMIDIPTEHLDFFRSLLPFYETPDYIFVHAGLRPGVPLREQSLDDLVWIRHEFIYSDFDFGKTVVFGHTPFSSPLIEDNKIGIDTGAVYGGSLTCVELPSRTIYEV